MPAGRYLIVNADDLGLADAVNPRVGETLNVTGVKLCSFAQVGGL